MATELFANQPLTTVTSGGTTAPSSGTTETWTVASSSSFPAAVTGTSQFHVCDTASGSASEIVAVTNVSGTTWSVTRGAESTTPVAHTSGFTVQQVVTAGWLGSVAPLPSGTATAGYVPVATGSGSASAWTAVGVPLKSGWWYPADGSGGNCTYAYNVMEIFPFDCGRAITIAQLAINIKSAGSAGTVIRLGVYASGADGLPGALLVDAGTVAGDSTGVAAVTGLAAAVSPGRIWLESVWQGTNSTAPQSQGYGKPLPSVGWSSYQQFPPVVGFQYSGVSGALPSSLPAPTSAQNNVVGAVQFVPQ